jgi:hypothetical protein
MTTNPSQKRQPKGTENGGQFAESKNPEATVDLMFHDDVSTEFRTWLSGRTEHTRHLLDDITRRNPSDENGIRALKSQVGVLEWVGSNFDRMEASPSSDAGPEFDGYTYDSAVNMADDEYPVTPEIWAEAVKRLNANGAANRINDHRYDIVQDEVMAVAEEFAARDAEVAPALICTSCSAPLSKSDYTGTAMERSGVKNHYKCPSCAAVSKMDADQ